MVKKDIFKSHSESEFTDLALKIFRHQYRHVPPYQKFCDLLSKQPDTVKELHQIPFLPIRFFKSKKVVSKGEPEAIFTSSGTTGSLPSNHLVTDISIYVESFVKGFELEYGPPSNYAILALLPSYLERQGSSLIYMVDHLIKESKHPDSGFYLNEINELIVKLEELEAKGQKSLLIGVSYALLDLIETKNLQLYHSLVMETGGMKGKRKEMIKEELHKILQDGFGVRSIHSEYGMTELLSQAYSKGGGVFKCPPWMKIIIRDPEDDQTFISGKTGGINVIDLANVNSCSFIATQDLGKLTEDGGFEILGRYDNSDIRGCNLMVI